MIVPGALENRGGTHVFNQPRRNPTMLNGFRTIALCVAAVAALIRWLQQERRGAVRA
jgi:hypothetical protein